LLLAVGGAVLLWRRRARAALWVLVVSVIIVTLNTMITYGQTRFRAGAEPSLALLAAVGAVAIVRWLRGRRGIAAPAVRP
jgi:asparagine N-glycosylation enzyme membrane subunit Stt3